MASEFMSYDQVLAELQLTREQLDQLVQKGQLRMLLDAGQKKFRTADVQAFKKKVEKRETIAQPPPEKKSDSRLDLAEIESAPGADVSDQTSVLAAASDTEETPTGIKEEPVFDFSEEEEESPARTGEKTGKLDLAEIEAAPGADVSDQTSVLPASEAAEESPAAAAREEPVFDFSEEKESSDSVLVADESESSADILQVAEEVEEESSSDLAALPAEETPKSSSSELSDTDVVSDVLSEEKGVTEEDVLETVDLAELEAPAGAPAAASAADELLTAAEKEEGSTAETHLVGEEETVGLEQAEAVTEGVGETLMEAAEEEAAEEGEGAPQLGPQVVPMAPPAAVAPVRGSLFANILLGISAVLVLFGGYLLLCGAISPPLHNPVTNSVVKFVRMLNL